MKSTLKTKIITAIIGTYISLAVITFAAVITMSGINPYIQLTVGTGLFLAGVATLILSGKKDSERLWCTSMFLVAVGGTTTLFAILTMNGFFTPRFL